MWFSSKDHYWTLFVIILKESYILTCLFNSLFSGLGLDGVILLKIGWNCHKLKYNNLTREITCWNYLQKSFLFSNNLWEITLIDYHYIKNTLNIYRTCDWIIEKTTLFYANLTCFYFCSAWGNIVFVLDHPLGRYLCLCSTRFGTVCKF